MWREECGSSGVAAAADGSSWVEPAGDDQSGGRACVRAGAQTWRAHLRGHQRGRSERASGRWRTFFEFTPFFFSGRGWNNRPTERFSHHTILVLTTRVRALFVEVVGVRSRHATRHRTGGNPTPGGTPRPERRERRTRRPTAPARAPKCRTALTPRAPTRPPARSPCMAPLRAMGRAWPCCHRQPRGRAPGIGAARADL